jgi:hypothetical protein
MTVDELLLETAGRLAEAKARGISADTWPEFCALLERTLAAVQPLAERAAERGRQLAAAREAWTVPEATRSAERARVKALYQDLRESQKRITKSKAIDQLAAQLNIVRGRVRQYLVGQK